MSHEALVNIASAATLTQPIDPLLPKHISERRRACLLKAVAHALELSPDHHPRILRHASRRPSEGEKRRFTDLQKRRDAQATTLGIDPTLIASRGVLSDLAYDWDKHSPELMTWQRELLKASPRASVLPLTATSPLHTQIPLDIPSRGSSG
jgi:ribonuclease D